MPKRTTGDRRELKPVNVGAAALTLRSTRPALTRQCVRLAHLRKTCTIWRTGSKHVA